MSPTSYLAAPPRDVGQLMLAPHQRLEPSRVGDREALPVVVEVGVDLGFAAHAGEALGPLLELGLGVVATPPAVAVVEADEGPVGRELQRLPRTLRVIAVGQRGAIGAQQLED